MPSRTVMLFRLTAFSATLALAACGQGSVANNMLALNDADPALTSALEDQIATDPNLAQQANRLSVRPPETPTRAEYPVAAGAAQVRRASGTSGAATPSAPGGGCSARGAAPDFRYGMEWANRLPAAFPPYPGGRVTEAAGQDSGECRVRVVTFRTADPYQRVIDWYQQRAVQAGFSAEHQARGSDHVLGGVNQGSNGAYYLIVTPIQGGSEVALIVNNGR
ncbi:MAG: hypothetical protein QOI38_2711 [Sphingomonadales bacterium]|jgi:hypothetical protein|nr:hypothetical protein [Sphingomonadales bacterium]